MESFPFYVLFLEIDPARVDVNVHPTKQEVKFEDDRLMYTYLNAAVRHALAKYNIAPSLDFSLNAEIQHLPAVELPQTEAQRQQTQKGYLSNTFRQGGQAHFIEAGDSLQRWKDIYAIATQIEPTPIPEANVLNTVPSSAGTLIPDANQDTQKQNILLVQDTYLLTTVKSGLMLIHIKRAQERISYERLLQQWSAGSAVSQRSLFPQQIELAPQDSILLESIIADLGRIGFDIAPFGKHTFVVQGLPPELAGSAEKQVLDEILELLKHEAPDAVKNRQDNLLMSLAKRMSRVSANIKQPEMQQALIDELFACSQPEYTAEGKRIFTMLRMDELDGLLA
jgi:DNA mismatch repair protein MutL